MPGIPGRRIDIQNLIQQLNSLEAQVSRLRMKIMIILLELVEISAENPALN
jgi:prefoldin subunit 5